MFRQSIHIPSGGKREKEGERGGKRGRRVASRGVPDSAILIMREVLITYRRAHQCQVDNAVAISLCMNGQCTFAITFLR